MKASGPSSLLPWIVHRGDWKDFRQAFSPLWSYSLISRIDVSRGEKVLKMDRPVAGGFLGLKDLRPEG